MTWPFGMNAAKPLAPFPSVSMSDTIFVSGWPSTLRTAIAWLWSCLALLRSPWIANE